MGIWGSVDFSGFEDTGRHWTARPFPNCKTVYTSSILVVASNNIKYLEEISQVSFSTSVIRQSM
jgi:hypothetical protein